jgi:hypothetical protein
MREVVCDLTGSNGIVQLVNNNGLFILELWQNQRCSGICRLDLFESKRFPATERWSGIVERDADTVIEYFTDAAKQEVSNDR